MPYYDRTGLVDTTLHTVFENLTIGMALVFLVLVFFLGNLRAAMIAAINIPLALLGAFTLMALDRTPANLISLGAVDFGIIIDSTVIVIENIHRHLSAGEAPHESTMSTMLRRGAGSRRTDVVFHRDFHDCLFAPVHDARSGGRDILADVAHLRVCAGHRDTARGHARPGAGLPRAEAGHEGISATRLRDGIKALYHGLFVGVLNWPRLTLTVMVADCRWPRYRSFRAWAVSFCPSWKRGISGFARPCR